MNLWWCMMQVSMSPSSSGSWSGARGADIIDLDRYMRGAVRPSRPAHPADPSDCELVVDAGGVKARHKRFSHDSGVSDSSYSRQRRHARPHRRPSAATAAGVDPTSTRTLDSTNSLRAFRTVCEQALLEQQRQIAHVAQLCERLTERAEKTERSDRPERSDHKDTRSSEQKDVRSCTSEQKNRRSYNERAKSEKAKSYTERRAKSASTADVSELSSSTSQSTKDPGRKDRHRTQQCKTYKIIMSKLDELNRLFSTRAGPSAPRAAPSAPRATPSFPLRPRAVSSSSVTVCDKHVATEPLATVGRVMAPSPKPRSSYSPRPCSLASRRVTQAFSVDIAPPQRPPNVVTESVVKCETENEDGSSSGGDQRCGFDLEDPIHLYSQAKKLQTLTATMSRGGRLRGRSAGPYEATRVSSRGEAHTSRSPSLCAACRDYWRSLRDCLLPQLFSQPDHCKC